MKRPSFSRFCALAVWSVSTFLFRPGLLCAAEVNLPEKVIIGQEKSAPYHFPFAAELPQARAAVRSKLPGAHLPAISLYRTDFSVGAPGCLGASFFWQRDAVYCSVSGTSAEVKPFPNTVGRLIFSVGRKQVNRIGLFDFSVSAGSLWNPPAARKVNGVFVPDNFSRVGLAAAAVSATLLPDRKIRPFLSISYQSPAARRDQDLTLMWPDWTGTMGVSVQPSEKIVCRLMLDYESTVAYGDPTRRSPEKWLPAVEISRSLRAAETVTLRINDFTNRQYRVFPAEQGPGLSAVLSYSRIF